MSRRRIKIALVVLVVLFTGLSLIAPLYPEQQLLQHSGTLLILLFLFRDVMKDRWSSSAFVGIVLFTFLHIIGARYIYSFVPYNQWGVDLLNLNIDDYFGFERNHFDRFVHFSFGVLLFPFCFYSFSRVLQSKPFVIALIAWLAIQSFSLLYEVFEWGLTLVVSGEAADNYNGQQGDVWDAQKDMALALLGSSLMFGFYAFKYTFFKRD